MKKILFLLICLFTFPLITYAADTKCTKDYESEIKSRARNVNVVYQLEGIKNNVASFRITVTNLTNDMVVFDNYSKQSKTYSSKDYSNGILVIKNAQSGTHSLKIYSKTCATTLSSLTVKTISLPKYNPYYNDKSCEGLEQYSLCQKWSGYSKSKKEFENEIKNLKETKNTANDDSKDNNTKEEKVSLYKLLIEYWYILLLALIIAICVYYLIASNSKKKEFNFKV